jgi:hypothetical protein
MRHKQRIAISRIISDLIKSDEVICREEIAAYNKIIHTFDITSEELYEAQQLYLEDAIKYLKLMPSDEQQRLYKTLLAAASAGYGCVSREALLLFSISACMNDQEGKYSLITFEHNGYRTDDKYVIYLESDYMPAINEEILEHYDTISNLLQLWNFEFIYIPKLSQNFREMDRNYLYDILRYMNPRFTAEMLNSLYDRLANFSTESYTRDYLVTMSQKDLFNIIEPSLLISVGVSLLPPSTPSQRERCCVNMLNICLDDEANSVLKEVRRMMNCYENLITEPEYHRPKRGKGLFRYHGFYKQLFDFLARHHMNGADNSILIDIPQRRIWMCGNELQMSATYLGTYMFILHQSLCTHHGGLIKAGQHHPLSEKDVERLGRTYHAICNLLRDNPITEERSYLDDVPNIRGYIARLRTMIEHHVDSQDLDYYFPKDSSDKSMYRIAINPSCVKIRCSGNECNFLDFPLWKKLNR